MNRTIIATCACLGALLLVGCAGAPSRAAAPLHAARPAVAERLVILDDFDDGGLSTGPRRVMIYLPQGYEQGDARYPVLYFHDGDTAFHFTQVPINDGIGTGADRAMDQLAAEGLIRPAIIVAVAHNDRNVELTPTATDWNPAGGGLDGYYRFLAERLKPYVDEHFRTSPGPEDTGVCGASLGGLASFLLAWKHPETFGMAGCQSPAFGYGGDAVLRTIEAEPEGGRGVRFWLDAARREFDGTFWRDAADVARALADRGLREGRDLAFQVDYRGEHDYVAYSSRIEPMIYFLLRTREPRLTSLRIVPLGSGEEKPFALGAMGSDTEATVEAFYDDWFRLNCVTADLTIEDPQVARLDRARHDRLTPVSAGVTRLRARFGGRKASATVIGYEPRRYDTYAVVESSAPVTVDGDLGDWAHLAYSVKRPWIEPAGAWTDPRDCSFRFGVRCDDEFVYVAVDVTDPTAVFDRALAPWEQDGVEVRLDAREDPDRAGGRGEGEGHLFAFFAASAAPDGGDPVVWQPELLPQGCRYAVRRTEGGYAAELAVPTDYLVDRQGRPWRAFRLNVMVDDVDEPGGPRVQLAWQPDWRSTQWAYGSGTFRRE